ncbi:outer membrane beta-barrel protein [Glaciecola petra]|uniref:Outer membrane beta-barrel protein n=1 Tax=Glaciecola petra TaxID=3075602 RepID=A0ABU2ZPR2_9ALTE|nr:outer membrane beta-barrel protein [Aestuariibacter sp. P117]MDT0593584.1 outer membrane beta-barrel protein [Aestuariibacter sp. P117]
MRTTFKLFIVILISMSFCAHAATKDGTFYAVSALGYADNEYVQENFDGFSYKLNIGYELNAQWAFETGFQLLVDNSGNFNVSESLEGSQEINSLSVSALGRASSRHGELFYRIGLLRLDSTFVDISNDEECLGTLLADQSANLICQQRDSSIAGVIGLGFDFYIHHSTLLRIEIEHIEGENDYSAQAVYIGFRLNF